MSRTSPSVYIEVDGTMMVKDNCRTAIGPTLTNPIISLHISDLSTFDISTFDIFPSDLLAVSSPRPMTLADLECPSLGVNGKTPVDWFNKALTIGPPYLPVLAIPPHILELQEEWKSTCIGWYTSGGPRFMAMIDPPRALMPADGLVPDRPSEQGEPAITPPALPQHEDPLPADPVVPALPEQTPPMNAAVDPNVNVNNDPGTSANQDPGGRPEDRHGDAGRDPPANTDPDHDPGALDNNFGGLVPSQHDDRPTPAGVAQPVPAHVAHGNDDHSDPTDGRGRFQDLGGVFNEPAKQPENAGVPAAARPPPKEEGNHFPVGVDTSGNGVPAGVDTTPDRAQPGSDDSAGRRPADAGVHPADAGHRPADSGDNSNRFPAGLGSPVDDYGRVPPSRGGVIPDSKDPSTKEKSPPGHQPNAGGANADSGVDSGPGGYRPAGPPGHPAGDASHPRPAGNENGAFDTFFPPDSGDIIPGTFSPNTGNKGPGTDKGTPARLPGLGRKPADGASHNRPSTDNGNAFDSLFSPDSDAHSGVRPSDPGSGVEAGQSTPGSPKSPPKYVPLTLPNGNKVFIPPPGFTPDSQFSSSSNSNPSNPDADPSTFNSDSNLSPLDAFPSSPESKLPSQPLRAGTTSTIAGTPVTVSEDGKSIDIAGEKFHLATPGETFEVRGHRFVPSPEGFKVGGKDVLPGGKGVEVDGRKVELSKGGVLSIAGINEGEGKGGEGEKWMLASSPEKVDENSEGKGDEEDEGDKGEGESEDDDGISDEGKQKGTSTSGGEKGTKTTMTEGAKTDVAQGSVTADANVNSDVVNLGGTATAEVNQESGATRRVEVLWCRGWVVVGVLVWGLVIQ